MGQTDWAELVHQEDVEGLWNAIFRLVSHHPAVRPLRFATDEAAVSSQFEVNADLAQELFLELFQKQRFQHYLTARYSSSDIENELTHIELPNLVGTRLRKRYPESFRMARRVSALVKASSAFRRFGPGFGDDQEAAPAKKRRGRPSKKDAVAALEVEEPVESLLITDDDLELAGSEHLAETNGKGSISNGSGAAPRRGRMVNQIYGLKTWPGSKAMQDSGHFTEIVKNVPMRNRDTRIVGRSGTSQLIISNPKLEDLIVEILTAIDSPADVKTIRQLTLSRIPLQDYSIASLDTEMAGSAGENGNGRARRGISATDQRETPEAALLSGERGDAVAELARDFVKRLRRVVNNNEQRYGRLLRTLWHCYYDPQEPSQLQIADLLGVSDSLVSDNRRLIEHELKKLSISVEEGPIFSESLRSLVAVEHRAF